MKQRLKIMRVSYPDIKVPQWQGRKLRGFFGAHGEIGSMLHNHGQGNSLIFRYPLVQYKVIHGVPTIMAIEDGISTIYPLVMDCEKLLLGDQLYDCGEMIFDLRKETIGDTEEVYHYRFVSPWFALNQANYRAYQDAPTVEKKEILNRVLTGNLLSLTKGLGITVESRLVVSADFRQEIVRFKSDKISAFWGSFSVNYILPDLIGLGKSISRGFGSVRRVKYSSTSTSDL